MHELMSMQGSRRNVQPMAGLAVHSRASSAEARVCAPQHIAEQLARVRVSLVRIGEWQ
jgi:hypothetical protein